MKVGTGCDNGNRAGFGVTADDPEQRSRNLIEANHGAPRAAQPQPNLVLVLDSPRHD